MNYLDLRKKYQYFEYCNYDYLILKGNMVLTYTYKISREVTFQHKLTFDIDRDVDQKMKNPEFENLVFHLGLAEMFSYWKLSCSPLIKISAGYLDDEQIVWWRDLLINGMGQYFYENNIDFTPIDFITITSSGTKMAASLATIKGEKTLVPIGGGKDSIVTLEKLGSAKMVDATLIVYPTTKYSSETVKLSGVKKVIYVDRAIDPELLKLNTQGFLNGHIPYTNVLFFVSLMSAYLGDYKNVAFSNEKSSDEGNLKYLNKSINHQYSKTFEFENLFREYNQKYLSNINLYSFLRPLYDIQIARIFSKYPKYFGVIKSCNVGQQSGIWCGECPKCLSTYILLFPFIGPIDIKHIFPYDLYENGNLINLLDDLILESHIKPFECIGTRQELKIGLFLSLDQLKHKKLPLLLNHANANYFDDEKIIRSKANDILRNWGDYNNLSDRHSRLLKKEI